MWAAASALTTAGGPVLGGWLTETFGWQAVFWINPPIAVAAVALLWTYAPADRLEPRRFDIVGAAIIAMALGGLAWALSQIGRSEAQAAASCRPPRSSWSACSALSALRSTPFGSARARIR